MKFKTILFSALMSSLTLCACSGENNSTQAVKNSEAGENEVISTIMSRRSVRDYKPNAISRDTMQIIAECGINAPNAMNKQPWELRVVDNPDMIASMTEAFLSENPKMADDLKFRNMFRNAPTVVFIASTGDDFSKLDCGLLGENMILSAWSMGIGSCCLGGPVAFLKSEKGAPFLEKLNFSEGYTLLYAIGFGYPAEAPEANPRDKAKVVFVD